MRQSPTCKAPWLLAPCLWLAANLLGCSPIEVKEAPDAGAASDAGVDAGLGPAPEAIEDRYSTFRESPLRFPAPGVLGNDLPARPGSLLAVLVEGPAHGTLTLEPSGAFVYLPEAGFDGEDLFSYAAADEAVQGPPVAVRVTVRPTVREPTLVLLVQHPENTDLKETPAEIETRFETINLLFEELSYNQLGLTGVLHPNKRADVLGWYTSASAQCLDLAEYLSLAEADTEIDFRAYRRVVIVLAKRDGCVLSAQGTITWPRQTPDGIVEFGLVEVSLPNASPTTITHELGHTLGNGHSHFLDCGSAVLADSGCTSVEYGDPYDLMGAGHGHFSAPRKEQMGWWSGPNQLLTVVESGTYALEPIETNSGGVKALKIPRGALAPLYVEYRQPLGIDAAFPPGSDVFEGALLHLGFGLLNASPPAAPYGPGAPTDAQLTPALRPGQSLVDPSTGTTVSVISRTSATLTVEVLLTN